MKKSAAITALAFGLTLLAVPVSAAPTANLQGTQAGAEETTAVQKAHWRGKRHCWWRNGKRHCRYVRRGHRHYYGYRPGIRFYFGTGRHHHHGRRHHRHH